MPPSDGRTFRYDLYSADKMSLRKTGISRHANILSYKQNYESTYRNKSTYVLMPRWGWMIAAHIAGTTTHAV